MKKRLILLFIAAFLPTIAQIIAKLSGSYSIGLTTRILVHFVIPVLAVSYVSKISLKESFLRPLHFKNKRKTILLAFFGGILSLIIIVVSLFIFMNLLDFNSIKENLEKINVTPSTYLYVVLIIIFVNPFLEEYFWRGFVFRVFDKYWKGYWTGILFALHHMIIIYQWFNWWQFLLITIFLSLIGLLFNWMYKQTDSIYASWFTHFIADLIIVIIGWIYVF